MALAACDSSQLAATPSSEARIFLFYPPTLNIICFVEKNIIFLRFCLCIFESDIVKSDCPV